MAPGNSCRGKWPCKHTALCDGGGGVQKGHLRVADLPRLFNLGLPKNCLMGSTHALHVGGLDLVLSIT